MNDNEEFIIILDSGKGNITIPNLEIGNYTIFGYYPGNNLNPESNYTTTFNVLEKVNVTISVNDTEVYQSKGLLLNIILSDDEINDNITVIFDNTTYEIEIIDGVGVFENNDLSPGEFELYVYYDGDYKYKSANATANITVIESINVTLTAANLTKYYNGSEKFLVNLVDNNNTPIVNASVQITINGNQYNRTTNENGVASLAINLNKGEYETTVYYDGGDGTYMSASSINTVIVLTTVNGTDITKIFKNGTQYYATFVDTNGNYLADGTEVTFNINGVMYTRKVNGTQGLARLNINLNPGEYILTATNPDSGEMSSNLITVIAQITENSDLVKYFKNNSQYRVKVLDSKGNAVGANETVVFNINGVMYERFTDANGYAKLNINLAPGEYVITAMYGDSMVSNDITVLPILTASDLTKKYGTTDQFKANLVDAQGNPYANQNVTFNINGVFYQRTTDTNGTAALNINLMPGVYIITSSYGDASTGNTVTVTR